MQADSITFLSIETDSIATLVCVTTADFINRAMADVLVAHYKGQRMTQATLVEATGINATTMQRILVGKSDVEVTKLAEFARVLGVPADELMRQAVAKAEAMSAVAATTDDVAKKRKQNEARSMTTEQIESQPHAATRDPEMDSDEPPTP